MRIKRKWDNSQRFYRFSGPDINVAFAKIYRVKRGATHAASNGTEENSGYFALKVKNGTNQACSGVFNVNKQMRLHIASGSGSKLSGWPAVI